MLNNTHLPVAARCVALLILVASLLPEFALAASSDPIGRVLIARGSVEAVATDGTRRALRRRAPVFEGDTVVTGMRGRSQIRFIDRAIMSIRPDTEIELTGYSYDAARPSAARSDLALRKGGFRTVTGSIGARNRTAYRVRTPLATIGVRGTDWEAFQEDGGEGYLGVDDGGIAATSISGASASLGQGAEANYAQVTLAGDFILLPEAPIQLAVSPAIGEGTDEGDEGDEGDDGDADAFGEAEDAGEAPDSDSGTDTVATIEAATEIDADTSEVNPVRSGDGGQSFLGAGGGPSSAELTRLQTGTQLAVFANAPEIFTASLGESSDPEVTAALAELGLFRGPILGVGAVSDDGDAVGAFDNFQLFLDGPPPNFPMQTRAQRFAEGFARYDDGAVTVSQRTNNPGGIADSLIGVYNASSTTPLPVQIDLATFAEIPASELPQAFFTVNLTEPIPFGRGPDLANLTASAFYEDVAFAGTSNFGTIQSVDSDLLFDISLGTGTITDGILDVFIQNTAGDQAAFIVDFVGSITNGVLDPVITDIEIFDTLDIAVIDDDLSMGAPATGRLVGSFIGTSATPGALLGWHYEEVGMGIGGTAPVITDGVVVLNDQGGMPEVELDDLNTSGFLFVATTCCFNPMDMDPNEAEIIAGRAQNAAASVDGNILAGFNVDMLGDPLDPSDPAFLTTPVGITVMNNEAVANFQNNLSVGGMTLSSVALVEFHGFPTSPISVTSSVMGIPNDTFDGNILFATFDPIQRAGLPTGATIYSSKGIGNLASQGFYNGPTMSVPTDALSVSFIANATTGTIAAGNLATDSMDVSNGGVFNTFFGDPSFIDIADGTTAVSLFDDMTPPNASFRQRNAIDVESVAGGSFDESGVFVGSYNLVSQAGGTFQSVGNFVIPAQTEARLSQAELGSIDRDGVVAFNPIDSMGALRSDLPAGIHPGIIAGYATNGGMDPIILGNDADLDEVDVFALPADSVVRIGGAALFNFTSNVQSTDLGMALPGFQVDWGTWNSTPMAAVTAQTDQNNAMTNTPIGVDVFFATLEDTTPTANIASMTGSVSYSGNFIFMSTSNAAVLGRGGSLATPTFSTEIEGLNASFDLDMGTGLVSSGMLQVQYFNPDPTINAVQFDAGFSGELNGAALDLQVDTLSVTHDGTGMSPMAGDTVNSAVSGALLGNMAEQAFGVFQLTGQGEHTEGFFLINRPR